MSEGASTPKKANLENEDLDSLTKAELIARVLEQDEYLKQIESRRPRYDRGDDEVEGPNDRVKQQQRDASRRENTLVHRLARKEQELQDYVTQIQEMKQAQTTGTAQLRSMLLDPAVNIVFQRMGSEMDAAQEKLKQTQNELSAWKFTPDSQTGKRLMARCQTLLQENEELGKTISSGRTAKLEGDIALQKTLVTEMKNNQSELDEFLGDLEEDVEGMQTMIYVLQQQLREAKEQIAALENENVMLRGGSNPDSNVSPKQRPKSEPQMTFRAENTNHNNHTNNDTSEVDYTSMDAHYEERKEDDLDMDTGYDEYYGGEDDYQNAEQNEYDYSENYEDNTDYKTEEFSNQKDQDYKGNNLSNEHVAMETDETLSNAAMPIKKENSTSLQPSSQTEASFMSSRQFPEVNKPHTSLEDSENQTTEAKTRDGAYEGEVGSTIATDHLTSSNSKLPREETLNIKLEPQDALVKFPDTQSGNGNSEVIRENCQQQPSYQTTVEHNDLIPETEISSTKRSPSPFVGSEHKRSPPPEVQLNVDGTHNNPTKDKSPIRTRSRRTRSHKEPSPPLENISRTKHTRKKSGEIKHIVKDSNTDIENPLVQEENTQTSVDNSPSPNSNSKLHKDISPYRDSRSPHRRDSPKDKSPRSDACSNPSTSPYKEREPVLQKFLNGVTSTVDDIEDL